MKRLGLGCCGAHDQDEQVRKSGIGICFCFLFEASRLIACVALRKMIA